MPDHLRPLSPQWTRRAPIHSHNMNFGGVGMIKVWASRMSSASSITPKGHTIAAEILVLAEELGEELKTRIDP